MCPFTVASVISNAAAISLLLFPVATSSQHALLPLGEVLPGHALRQAGSHRRRDPPLAGVNGANGPQDLISRACP